MVVRCAFALCVVRQLSGAVLLAACVLYWYVLVVDSGACRRFARHTASGEAHVWARGSCASVLRTVLRLPAMRAPLSGKIDIPLATGVRKTRGFMPGEGADIRLVIGGGARWRFAR